MPKPDPDPDPNLPQRLKRLKSHVLAPLFKHSKSTPFREPVDAKALGIYPAYHQVLLILLFTY